MESYQNAILAECSRIVPIIIDAKSLIHVRTIRRFKTSDEQ